MVSARLSEDLVGRSSFLPLSAALNEVFRLLGEGFLPVALIPIDSVRLSEDLVGRSSLLPPSAALREVLRLLGGGGCFVPDESLT
jgi:hypothetical protein